MAVILALLFRGFVAEAFVIPTGLDGPDAGWAGIRTFYARSAAMRYQVSCSDEQREERITGDHVSYGTCPVCRYTQRLDPLRASERRLVQRRPDHRRQVLLRLGGAEALGRDRLQVSGQCRAELHQAADRPAGREVRIVGGNIYTCGKDEPDEALRIARKPPHKLDALLADCR